MIPGRLTGSALAALLLIARPAEASPSVEEQNAQRAKAGLLPKKLPPKEPPPPEAGPPPPPAAQAAAASPAQPSAPPAPRRLGPLDGAVAAARGLASPGVQDGADARVDGVAALVAGLQVRSTIRVRAGDVSLVVEQRH